MAVHGSSIYLHFLDRELGESVGQSISSDEVQIVLKLLTLLTGSVLNCSVSSLFESPAITSSDPLRMFIQLLVESRQLSLLSSHPTIEEFVESRTYLYEHDRLRYPMYFGGKIFVPNSLGILPKSSSATQTLSRNLRNWGLETEDSNNQEIDAKNVVLESLRQREGRAVTAALFGTASSKSRQPKTAVGIIRRQISIEYTKHFMSTLNSDIATGINGIEFYDQCASDYPKFDIPILIALSRSLAIRNLIEEDWKKHIQFWTETCHQRNVNDGFAAFSYDLDIFLSALSKFYIQESTNNITSFRLYIKQILDKSALNLRYEEINVDENVFYVMSSRFRGIMSQLSNSNKFNLHVERARAEHKMSSTYKYVIMVATEIERESVFEKVRSFGNKITPSFGGGRGYYDLGYINGSKIALVKAEMGSGTVGGSATTTIQIVNHIKPKFIIMVGIAFGIDSTKQSIGTVLVSRQILNYEHQRVGATKDGNVNITVRGDRTSASPILVSLLQTAAGVWNDAKTEVGLMLSGDKLVDDVNYRDNIKNLSSNEAIGGEMEGAGLMIASAETGTQWVVVKAICDWADGNKSHNKKENQTLAAKNAVSLVFQALQISLSDSKE